MTSCPTDDVLVNPRSEYRVIRRYHGKVKAVVFDWAGMCVWRGDVGVCVLRLN